MMAFSDGLNAGQFRLPEFAFKTSAVSDTINGTDAAETLSGGNGSDVIDGNRGADTMLGGNGDDLLIWDPGDGSDVLDGGNGVDTHQFNLANASELISIIETDGHAILTRNVGPIVMDLDNIERISLGGAGGGADTFFIGDLSATDVRAVDIDLGAVPDALVDNVSAVGGATSDHVRVTSGDGVVRVDGLTVDLTVSHAEAADRLVVNGLDGDDRIDATGFAGGVSLVLWGGPGADSFLFGPSTGASIEVLDFLPHTSGADGDLILLRGFADHSFDAAVADGHIAQSAADVVISDDGGTIVTLRNVSLSDLTADDFLFA
jgi:hypothetical protein